jgi:hypothetical protein
MFLLVAVNQSEYRLPLWLDFEPQLDSEGFISEGRGAGRMVVEFLRESVFDANYLAQWKKLLQTILTRYLDDSYFAGLRIRSIDFGDSANPVFLQRDYSESAQAGYKKWLAAKNLPPAPLAVRRYVPGEKSGGRPFGPDLSKDLQLFHEFREDSHVERIESVLQACREVDPVRPIIFYRGPRPGAFERALPILAKYGACFHDEGGPNYMSCAITSMSEVGANLPYTHEGHRYTPPSSRMIDASIFYGGLYSKGWDWVFRWFMGHYKAPAHVGIKAAMEHLHRSLPALHRWAEGRARPSEILVLGSRKSRLLGGMRLGFYSHMAGLGAFETLFDAAQAQADFVDDYLTWVDLSPYKVVFVEGEIFDESWGAKLENYVKAGGKVVLVNGAGKYCPQRPEERDLLVRRLAGNPSVREISLAHKGEPGSEHENAPRDGSGSPDLENVLTWAGVNRPLRSEGGHFQVFLKNLDGNGLLAAVFRPYEGNYEDIWFENQQDSDAYFEALRKTDRAHIAAKPKPYKEDFASPTVVVSALKPGGRYRLKQIHRDAKDLGEHVADAAGVLKISLPPLNRGMLALLEIHPLP